LKRYEKESLLKNFLVFFSLLSSLLILLFLELYHVQKHEYKEGIFKNMQVCSYTMECTEFSYNFVEKDKTKLNALHENNKGLQSYFIIPKSDKFYLEIAYTQKPYQQDIDSIQKAFLVKFILALLLLFILAVFFTFYSLSPIRKALVLNDEFIKDILHDFNTPISAMLLNIKMFQDTEKSNIFIKRIAQSMQTMIFLQNNLKCFLQNSPSQNSFINIAELLKERQEIMQDHYAHLKFTYTKKNDLISMSNAMMLTRIFDNILSNACKYNSPKGKVTVTIEKHSVSITDTGKGIQHIDKVLERYYKEQDRGLGLGLHIVQKLVTELNIDMKITSEVNRGTTFILDFKHLESRPL